MKTLEAAVKKKKKPAGKKSAPQEKGKKPKKEQDERFASRFSDPRFGYGKKKQDVEKDKKVITEKDARFPLDKFKGKVQTSRGAPLKKGPAKKRDLTSIKEPQSIPDYYKQLRTNQGQDVESEDEDEDEESVALSQADDISSGSSKDFDDDASLGSDIYEENRNEVTEEATKRLALRNCDWDNLDANHLYALMQSFMPMGGALMDVKIYTSELGKEKLKKELEEGPDLWVKPGEADAEEEDAEDEDEDEGEEAELLSGEEDEEDEEADIGFDLDNPAVRTEVGADGERFSENRYRRYEIQRLKYYYAIIEFDSPETAAHVYRECDGTEIEHSGTVFDLSFVPDDMEFTDEPKDSCNQLVRGFKANTGFVTNALQNSKFAISWDQTDPKRKQAIQGMFSAHDHKDDDLDAYLAPCESSDDGEAPSKEKIRSIRSKYACLFENMGGLAADKPEEDEEVGEGESEDEDSDAVGVHAQWSDDDVDPEEAAMIQQELEGMESDEGDEGAEGAEGKGPEGVVGDMSSTIHIGAKEGSKNLKDVLKVKQDREGETVWEKRLRKKKESRKLAKKERGKAREDDDEESEEDKEEQRRKIKEALGDDAIEVAERPKIGRKDKRKAHKAKVVAEAAKEREKKKEERAKLLASTVKKPTKAAAPQEETKAENKLMSRFSKLADPRFQADPNHPKFKDSRAMQELVTDIRTTRKRKVESTKTEGDAGLSSKVDYFNKKAKQQ